MFESWTPSPADWEQLWAATADADDGWAGDDPPPLDDQALLDWMARMLEDEPPPDEPEIRLTFDVPPGAYAALRFECTEFSAVPASDLLDAMVSLGRLASWAQALQSRAIGEFARRSPPCPEHDQGFGGHPDISRYVTDEIACALSLTPRAAETRLTLAIRLDEALTATYEAWQRGDLDWPRVSTIAERTSMLTPEQAREVESRVLPRTEHTTLGQLRRLVDRAVIDVDPDAANARHRRARQDRDVTTLPADDGMTVLAAHLTAEEAALAFSVLTRIARGAPKDDGRSPGQRRADALMGLLTGDRPAADRVASDHVAGDRPAGRSRAAIEVIVNADTLAGLDDRPAELVGHGAIPAEQARRLAADGVWRRLRTDPATGVVLDYGRTTYRPPQALADYVRARDRVCRFPTCHRPAGRADLDHQRRYRSGGSTAAGNLWALCRRHHLLKDHHPGWSVCGDPGGSVTWTSPTGRTYTSEPYDHRVGGPS